ncbi:UbiD family decarboxylase [Alsobacter sp. SYSU M60028]|uniref:UbiD family decarboxylase n=1 Tax=Alsobacter ponti TaxID=2962936 RepID=A0ABT1L7G2_9HYPH|nr:UbiD family decarboxylase [Alsobacter ponti]MCP8937407.1 UbiD family decarboxylase [Alsobacter ponti]
MTDAPCHRRSEPVFRNLRDFLATLEARGQLHRIARPVSLVHEMTEIHRRVVAGNGPALLFEAPVDAQGVTRSIPALVNLFGTVERIAWGLGIEPDRLRDFGSFLAELREPRPPRGFADLGRGLGLLRAALSMREKTVSRPAVQQRVLKGGEVDLSLLPVQWCWPGEPAPLVTWPLVITRAPDDTHDVNVGVYRMQVAGPNRLIVRWLAHRGGAKHHRLWARRGEDMPVTIAIGADPATMLAAVLPLPETIGELGFSGLLRGAPVRLARALTTLMPVPADAEIVLEGTVSATETAEEGPYGDHTGYYNAVDDYPVMTVSALTMREQPLYLSTFTGRPPDEPSRLGEALTELFVPVARRQFPEIEDLWLPPEACSYRAIVVSIDKRYPGQARRLMMGLWSLLPQFSYAKLIIVVDQDIPVRSWPDVMWAVATRFDAPRDLLVVPGTPIDALDFASARPGLGGKMGLDATIKIGPETDRPWGRVLDMDQAVKDRVDAIWSGLGIGPLPAEVVG